MDELWSFVDHQGNKQWVWLALDAETREIVGVHIGNRSAASAGALWQSMPPVYRQCALIYSDFWAAIELVLPSRRHHAVGKETGKTSYPHAVQLYPSTTSVPTGQKNIVIFKKARQSHWRDLEFYPSLQCFFTS